MAQSLLHDINDVTETGSAHYSSAREAADFRHDYTAEIARATRPIYQRVRHVIPEIEWAWLRALRARHQSPQTRKERRHLGA